MLTAGKGGVFVWCLTRNAGLVACSFDTPRESSVGFKVECMWPTQGAQSAAPSPLSERGPRARLVAIVGIAALVLLILAASLVGWLETAGKRSAPVYGSPRVTPGAVWTWDGVSYTQASAGGPGPTSNKTDMAYDRTAGVIVLWDHGCAGLVMGFQGGCVAQVNRTWTWDGLSWTARSMKSAPKETGPGAMVYDGRLRQVVYMNGVGQAWTWTGFDWKSIETPGAPRVARRDLAAPVATFAAGYDESRDLRVLALSTSTWTWDGSTWKEVAGGIEPGDARPDAHLVYDRIHSQLLYVGSRFTWTWDGTGWQKHAEPAIASGTLGYDAVRRTVMLVQQDSSACDQKACRTTIWNWDGKLWTQVPADRVPLLPLTRSGASLPPMAFDEARGVMMLFASVS